MGGNAQGLYPVSFPTVRKGEQEKSVIRWWHSTGVVALLNTPPPSIRAYVAPTAETKVNVDISLETGSGREN